MEYVSLVFKHLVMMSAACLPSRQQIITEVSTNKNRFHQQEPFPQISIKWIKLTESLLAEDTQLFGTLNFRSLYMTWNLGINFPTRKLYLLHEFTKVKGKLFTKNFIIHAQNTCCCLFCSATGWCVIWFKWWTLIGWPFVPQLQFYHFEIVIGIKLGDGWFFPWQVMDISMTSNNYSFSFFDFYSWKFCSLEVSTL